MEYCSTKYHGNADSLSHLLVGNDDDFNREEEQADVSVVCNVRELSRQLNPVKPKLIAQETAKDQVLSKVQCYTKEGYPRKLKDKLKQFKKLEDSLVTNSGCLFYKACLIILDKPCSQVLELLHLQHFGMHWMKELARLVVYWPHIDVPARNSSERAYPELSTRTSHPNQPIIRGC